MSRRITRRTLRKMILQEMKQIIREEDEPAPGDLPPREAIRFEDEKEALDKELRELGFSTVRNSLGYPGIVQGSEGDAGIWKIEVGGQEIDSYADIKVFLTSDAIASANDREGNPDKKD